MKTLHVTALAALVSLGGLSVQAEELRLDDTQLDNVTAGFITSDQVRSIVAASQAEITGDLGEALVGDRGFTLGNIPGLVAGTQGQILGELTLQLGSL